MSDWYRLGESDHQAGYPRHYGSVRVAGLWLGKRSALCDWRLGWDTADLREAGEAVERTRALADAPLIGRTVAGLAEASYELRRETALGLSAQLEANPDSWELRAMLAGAIASAKAASGVDVDGEAFAKVRALFGDDPVADIRAVDALRSYTD